MATDSIILAWRITEEPEGYSPWGYKESDMTEATEHRCMRRADGSKCCQLAPEFTLGKVYSFKENIVMKYVDKER